VLNKDRIIMTSMPDAHMVPVPARWRRDQAHEAQVGFSIGDLPSCLHGGLCQPASGSTIKHCLPSQATMPSTAMRALPSQRRQSGSATQHPPAHAAGSVPCDTVSVDSNLLATYTLWPAGQARLAAQLGALPDAARVVAQQRPGVAGLLVTVCARLHLLPRSRLL